MPCLPILLRMAILLPVVIVATVTLAGDPEPMPKPATIETYRGQIVPVAEQLKKLRIALDADASPAWLAIKTNDDKWFPLIKDAGSRMFFHDSRLLNRPMEIQGRFVPGAALFQVTHVNSIKDGVRHDVYYWCEVCSIKRFSLEKTGICECCGGPMELKEVPIKK